MRSRVLHTVIGLTLLFPFLGWVVTGFIFFIKPGYAQAYESLQPKTYPLNGEMPIKADPSWLEVRCLRTVLGDHLLARTDRGWQHIDPHTMRVRDEPGEEEIRSLVTDACSMNPERYGQVERIAGKTIYTNTGIRISLDWNRMSFQQRGPDTDRIDWLYRIHYLQWTGMTAIDRVLGPLGLILVMALSMLGVRLAISSMKRIRARPK